MSAKPKQQPSQKELSSSIRDLTDTIEARQQQKNKKRAQKKKKQKRKEKAQAWERLVAPIILLITIALSLLALAMR